MAYSYTEKEAYSQRFRFVTQGNGYPVSSRDTAGFIQQISPRTVSHLKTADEHGLHAAFKSVFPIVSYSGNAALEYVDYALGEPVFDVDECVLRGTTYACALRVKVRLVIYDKESSSKSIKDIKEQDVYHGGNPSDDSKRYLRHQWYRAGYRFPVAPFSGCVLRPRSRQNPFLRKSCSIARESFPYRGSWLDFEFDPKDLVYVRIDRRRKLPATDTVACSGVQTPKKFSTCSTRPRPSSWAKRVKLTMTLVPKRLQGDMAAFDIMAGKQGHCGAWSPYYRSPHSSSWTKAGIELLSKCPAEYLVEERRLAKNIVDTATGEVLAEVQH